MSERKKRVVGEEDDLVDGLAPNEPQPASRAQQLFFFRFADGFDLGYDIQSYYSLYQGLTLEDLAKTNTQHTVKGIIRVVRKVSGCAGRSHARSAGATVPAICGLLAFSLRWK